MSLDPSHGKLLTTGMVTPVVFIGTVTRQTLSFLPTGQKIRGRVFSGKRSDRGKRAALGDRLSEYLFPDFLARAATCVTDGNGVRALPVMPILPKQRDQFPADLFEGDPEVQLASGTAAWIAFYTLARREKDLMRRLVSLGIPFYSPLVSRRLPSAGGRVRTSWMPLFPSYVFSLVDDDQRRAALATNTISRWLSVPDQRMLDDDLRSIKRLIDSEMPLTPEARLEQGQPVRVRSGPLRGMEGTVVGRKGEQRLVVAVRFLNQGASIELEDVDLERL